MRIFLILTVLLFMGFSCSRSKKKEESGSFFTEIQILDIVSSRAVFHFKTAEPTTCVAEYGLTEDNLDMTATDPEMTAGEFTTDHIIPLEDLEEGVQYFVRAKAVNEGGAEFLSAVTPFTTLVNNTSPEGENLASLSDISITNVSSNFGDEGDDSTFGAEKAFDGSFYTEWATSGDGDNASITFEFDSPTEVGKFGFRSRKMSDGTGIISKVRLLFDDVENAVLTMESTDQLNLFNFSSPSTVTKVTIEAVETTGGNTGAKEIRFYAP